MTGPSRSGGADRLLTVRQAAAFLGETVSRFTQLPAYQNIPVTPRRPAHGAKAVLMYRLADLEAWLDANEGVAP